MSRVAPCARASVLWRPPGQPPLICRANQAIKERALARGTTRTTRGKCHGSRELPEGAQSARVSVSCRQRRCGRSGVHPELTREHPDSPGDRGRRGRFGARAGGARAAGAGLRRPRAPHDQRACNEARKSPHCLCRHSAKNDRRRREAITLELLPPAAAGFFCRRPRAGGRRRAPGGAHPPPARAPARTPLRRGRSRTLRSSPRPPGGGAASGGARVCASHSRISSRTVVGRAARE